MNEIAIRSTAQNAGGPSASASLGRKSAIPPGVRFGSAFDALVLFNLGEITAAVRSTVLFCFGVGAMAMGLAAARSITQPEWIKE